MAQRHIYALRFSMLISLATHKCVSVFSGHIPGDIYIWNVTNDFHDKISNWTNNVLKNLSAMGERMVWFRCGSYPQPSCITHGFATMFLIIWFTHVWGESIYHRWRFSPSAFRLCTKMVFVLLHIFVVFSFIYFMKNWTLSNTGSVFLNKYVNIGKDTSWLWIRYG